LRIWIIQDGEPLPGIDPGTRDWRCSILSKELLARGHQVLWWASTFDHAQKKFRRNKPCTIETETGMKFRLLHGPGYNSNKNPRRFLHQRAIGRAFAHEAVNFPVPDIIFCGLPLPELAEQAIIYGHKYDVPAIIDVRDQWPDIYLTMVPSSLQRFARLLLSTEFRRMERVFQSASAIVSISETYLNWALKYAGRARCSMDRVFALGHNAPNCIRHSFQPRPKRLLIVHNVQFIVGSATFNSLLKVLHSLDSSWEVLVRPHPLNRQTWSGFLEAINTDIYLVNLGILAQEETQEHASLEAALEKSRVVVGSSSMTVIEAWIAGCKCIYLGGTVIRSTLLDRFSDSQNVIYVDTNTETRMINGFINEPAVLDPVEDEFVEYISNMHLNQQVNH